MAEPALELEPELGPEVEVVAKAVPRLGAVAVLVVCLGIILAVDAICRAFFGTVEGALGWIPFAGKIITSPIRSIEHKVVSFLAGLENDIDAAIAHNVHVAARLLDKAWHTLELMAANIVLLGALATAGAFHYLIHPLEKWVRGVIRKVEEEIHHLERGLHGATVVIHKTITHVIMPGIKHATVAVPRYLHRELHTIRHEAHEAEKLALRSWKVTRSLERKLSHSAIAVAVAAALAALGLDWLSCKDGASRVGRSHCDLWDDLGKLLGIAFIGAEIASLDELIGVAQTVTEDVTKGVETLLKV